MAGWTILVSFVQRCRSQFTKHRAPVKVVCSTEQIYTRFQARCVGSRVPVIVQWDTGNWGGNTPHTNVRGFWQIYSIAGLICVPAHVHRHSTLNDSQSLIPHKRKINQIWRSHICCILQKKKNSNNTLFKDILQYPTMKETGASIITSTFGWDIPVVS
jgi:hypothetical protein